MSAARVPMVLPVRVQLETRALQATTREISEEGVFVRAAEHPRPGTQVGLRIYLPGMAQAAEFVGIVREGPGSEPGFWADFVSGDAHAHARLLEVLHPGKKPAPQPLGSIAKRTSGAGSETHRAQEPTRTWPEPEHAPRPGGPAAARPPPPPPDERASDVVLAGDPINRRAFPRYRARFAVRFATVQDFVLEYAANISAGGVFVVTDQPPEMNSFITVVMELPGIAEPVSARAQVVHRVPPEMAARTGEPAGVGVQFVETDAAFRQRLDQAIETILAKERK